MPIKYALEKKSDHRIDHNCIIKGFPRCFFQTFCLCLVSSEDAIYAAELKALLRAT